MHYALVLKKAAVVMDVCKAVKDPALLHEKVERTVLHQPGVVVRRP